MPSPPAPWVESAEIEVRLAAAGVSGVDVVRAAQAATDFLYERSGRRFNQETWTVRPTRGLGCGCSGDWGSESRDGSITVGRIGCGCDARTVELTPFPVLRVESVTVDGVALTASDYALYDSRRLVRVDGLSWPCCQRLDVATTEVGTMAVTFRAGDTVPDLGYLAALELAYQIGLKLGGDDACALPERAVSVTRQGIEITLSDVTYLQEGMFGIPLIDQFLLAFPARPRASFMGPDDVRMRSSGGGT